MKCCICGKKLNGWDDCPERWQSSGSHIPIVGRVIICKSEECNKKYTTLIKEKYNKK